MSPSVRRGTDSRPSGRAELLQAVIEHLASTSVEAQSLRGIAEAIGTSHRMLIYHFESRDGLLAEVVSAVEQLQTEAFTVLTDPDDPGPPREVARAFWSHVVGPATRYGPLFFELSAHAMQGRPHARALADSLVEPWLEALSAALVRDGMDASQARTRARLGLATVRGLLFDLLVTGDRSGVDEAFEAFLDLAEPVSSPSPAPDSGQIEREHTR